MSITDIVQAASSVASLGVAGAALRVARRATESADASADATKNLSDIEERREHREMFPQVKVYFRKDPGGVVWKLVVELEGPDVLDHLDRFQVTIRDDQDRSAIQPNEQRSQEEIDRQIWGPFLLRPNSGVADERGRSSIPVPLTIGERWEAPVHETSEPSWWTESGAAERWDKDYLGTPIRLTIHCEREGFAPWVLRREVPDPREKYVPPSFY
ncbi:hypothetical protein [Actinomadura harenae]|uniref:Uncharacterized protein n=1 Tax=Actinomadura harenae TaxID=2483351 RepID=A0A3M2LQC9_9ACTN|nr:hypothetical protein [Actinomadura harenae]RMI39296.1 hypothetical protein EBO15_30050 [Actinomadura harenae]